MERDTKSFTVSPAKIKEQKSQWPFIQRRAFPGLFLLKSYFFLTITFRWLMFNKIFTKLSVSFFYILVRIHFGEVFRYLDLAGNSIIMSWEEIVFIFGSGRNWDRQLGNCQRTVVLLHQVPGGWLPFKVQPQGYVSSSIFLSIFFLFLFLLKLQQVCGYFLKEFSAKVVPLAILRSCPRFENMRNADMCFVTSNEKKVQKNFFSWWWCRMGEC